MPLPVRSRRLALLAGLLTCTAPLCHAASYTVFMLESDQARQLLGLQADGKAIVYNSLFDRYDIFQNGTMVQQTKGSPDVSLFDNGIACSPVTPSTFQVGKARCNGDRIVLDGHDAVQNPNSFEPALYSGMNFAKDQVAFGGDGALMMNADGVIVWDDVYSEAIFEAVPQAVSTVSAVTPEPATLLLLFTGLSVASVFPLLRRRSLRV